MKRTLWISVAVVTVFALSLNAIAQPPAGGQRPAGQAGVMGQMGGGASPAALLRHAEVIRMLALTEAQTTALNEVFRPGQRGQGGGQGGQFAGFGQGGTAAGAAAAMQQRNAEMWAGIDRVLNAQQQARFREIFFQANGGLNAPMLDAWMLAVVDLTPAQQEAIAEIVAARAEATRAAGGFGGGQGGMGGMQQLTAEERQARTAAAQERNAGFANQIIRQVLTQEQRTRARQLTAGSAAMRETLGLPALPALQGQGQGPQGQGVGPGQRQGAGAQPGAAGPGQRGGQGAGAALPDTAGPGQRGGQGAGAALPGTAGPGQRGGGQGGGGGGFVPGSNTENWQPGQGRGAGAGAGARGTGGGGARGGGGN